MEALIVEPLSSSGVSTVIIIEHWTSGDEDPQSAILSVMAIGRRIRKSNSFITGRPEVPRTKCIFRVMY